jgi:hypothetical protein
MPKRLVQLALVVPVWLWIYKNTAGVSYQGQYFHIITLLGIAFAVLAIFIPKKWAMGLNNYLMANIMEKISPLVFSVGMLLLMGRMTQTYTVVIVSTFFFSNSISYAAYIVADVAVTKVRRFLRMKKG